jgi:hypothetical protein
MISTRYVDTPDDYQLELRFQDNSTDETEFRIYEFGTGATNGIVATIPADATPLRTLFLPGPPDTTTTWSYIVSVAAAPRNASPTPDSGLPESEETHHRHRNRTACRGLMSRSYVAVLCRRRAQRCHRAIQRDRALCHRAITKGRGCAPDKTAFVERARHRVS